MKPSGNLYQNKNWMGQVSSACKSNKTGKKVRIEEVQPKKMSQLAAPKMSRQRRPSIASAPTDPNAVMKTFPKTNDERKFLMAKVRNSKHFLLKDLTEPQVVMFVGALYVLQSLSFERII